MIHILIGPHKLMVKSTTFISSEKSSSENTIKREKPQRCRRQYAIFSDGPDGRGQGWVISLRWGVSMEIFKLILLLLLLFSVPEILTAIWFDGLVWILRYQHDLLCWNRGFKQVLLHMRNLSFVKKKSRGHPPS